MSNSLFHIGQADKAGIPIWNNGAKKYYWQDKAGGYGIQDPFGMKAVKGIVGDYYNVIGLPVCRLVRMLREFGIDI